MLEYATQELEKIDRALEGAQCRAEALASLRRLSLSDYGQLTISLPNPAYPNISRLMPRMASDEVQTSWTGSAGLTLLNQSVDFIRTLAYNYTKITGRPLQDAKVLDYGCGYGRLTRLIYYFTAEDNVCGVDPWDKSIEICHGDGLSHNIVQSDYLPASLPVGDRRFDLIFAFSVFTHLSKRATGTCLRTLADYVTPDGVICVTIRPVEYWDIDVHARRQEVVERQKEVHRAEGFAFLPHNLPPIDGDVTYGDTSMTTEWLERSFPFLELVGLDRSLSDPYQTYLFLRKR